MSQFQETSLATCLVLFVTNEESLQVGVGELKSLVLTFVQSHQRLPVPCAGVCCIKDTICTLSTDSHEVEWRVCPGIGGLT